MDYRAWEESVPAAMTGDALWSMRVHRLSLFAADIAWSDVTRLAQDHRTRALSEQLYRALGSIGANIAEGYSRGSGKDRSHFYEYALGSARESRDWYYKARHLLGQDVLEHRLSLMTEIIRLLLTIVPRERHHTLKQDSLSYDCGEAPVRD